MFYIVHLVPFRSSAAGFSDGVSRGQSPLPSFAGFFPSHVPSLHELLKRKQTFRP
jgi:hypothetical protein